MTRRSPPLTPALLALCLTSAGCYSEVEAPPPTGPCGYWRTGVDGVRSNRPSARFVRLGGALELRQFWMVRAGTSSTLDTGYGYGEVVNVSDVVVCEGESTIRVDGHTLSPLSLWAPPYDDGGEASVACLAPGERGYFEAHYAGAFPGDVSPEYGRVEYDLGAVARPDAVPHPFAPELIDITWTEEDPVNDLATGDARVRADGAVSDLRLELLARDRCGTFFAVARTTVPLATPPAFEVALRGSLDTTALPELELLPFFRFRLP